MAKKTTEKKSAALSPAELAAYKPEDQIPKIQAEFAFGLDSTLALAKQSGASVIGDVHKPATLPQIKQ